MSREHAVQLSIEGPTIHVACQLQNGGVVKDAIELIFLELLDDVELYEALQNRIMNNDVDLVCSINGNVSNLLKVEPLKLMIR